MLFDNRTLFRFTLVVLVCVGAFYGGTKDGDGTSNSSQ